MKMKALRLIAASAEALRFKPIAVIAYIFRGLDYNKKGDYGQAIAEYDQALSLAAAYNNQGFAYHLAFSLLAVLVVVLPLSGLAVVYNNDAGFLLAVLAPLLLPGLTVAYNNQVLTYHLFSFLLAVLVVVLPLLGLAVVYNHQVLARLAFSLLAVPVVVLPLLGLAVAYYNKGLARLAGLLAVLVVVLPLWLAVAYYNKGLAAGLLAVSRRYAVHPKVFRSLSLHQPGIRL